MLFPFYITGRSEKYGPYTSVFPLYGDLYERFWRDEYHYVLFPVIWQNGEERDNDPKLSVSFLLDHTWGKRARFSVLAGLWAICQGGGLQ